MKEFLIVKESFENSTIKVEYDSLKLVYEELWNELIGIRNNYMKYETSYSNFMRNCYIKPTEPPEGKGMTPIFPDYFSSYIFTPPKLSGESEQYILDQILDLYIKRKIHDEVYEGEVTFAFTCSEKGNPCNIEIVDYEDYDTGLEIRRNIGKIFSKVTFQPAKFGEKVVPIRMKYRLSFKKPVLQLKQINDSLRFEYDTKDSIFKKISQEMRNEDNNFAKWDSLLSEYGYTLAELHELAAKLNFFRDFIDRTPPPSFFQVTKNKSKKSCKEMKEIYEFNKQRYISLNKVMKADYSSTEEYCNAMKYFVRSEALKLEYFHQCHPEKADSLIEEIKKLPPHPH